MVLYHSTETFRRGNFLYFKNVPVDAKMFIYINEGHITILCRNFFVSQYRKTSYGNISVFQLFQETRFVGDKTGGGYYVFPSKLFCLAVPKHCLEEPFVFQKRSFNRRNTCIRGGYHDFLSEKFCVTVPKHCVEEHFHVSKTIRLSIKYIHKTGLSRFCIRKFRFHSSEKLCIATLLCFTAFGNGEL